VVRHPERAGPWRRGGERRAVPHAAGTCAGRARGRRAVRPTTSPAHRRAAWLHHWCQRRGPRVLPRRAASRHTGSRVPGGAPAGSYSRSRAAT